MLLHGGLQQSRFRPMHAALVPDRKIVAREFVGMDHFGHLSSKFSDHCQAWCCCLGNVGDGDEHSKAPLQLWLWGNRQCRCLYFLLLHPNKSNRTEMVAVEFILGVVGTPRNTGSLIIPDFC